MNPATTTTKAGTVLQACLWMVILIALNANLQGQTCTFPPPIISASPSTSVCSGPVTLSVEGSIVNDIDILQPATGLAAQDHWQTFTPTVSGSLRAIEVLVDCANSAITFTLYNGSGIGGTVINSQSVNMAFCSPRIYAPTFTGVNLVAGNTYTFRIQASQPVQLALTSSGYGTYYNDTQSEPLYRLGFKTYMYRPFTTVQWYNEATAIAGATSLTYQASSPGNYWCTSFSGACYSTPSNVVVLTNDPPRVPSVTASGNTTVCSGNSVALTAGIAPVTDLSFVSMSFSTNSLKKMWQSFVPVTDGMTTSIKIRPAAAYVDTLRLNIYSGLGVYGTLISSQRLSIAGGGPGRNYEIINLPITTPLHLTPGNTYTFELLSPGINLMADDGTYGTYFDGYHYETWRPNFQTVVAPFMNDIQWFNGAFPVPGATSSIYNATISGNYYCKNGLSSCYPVSSDSINVTVNAPLVDAGSALPELCRGATTPALGGSFSGGGVTGAVWADGGAGGTFTNNSGSTPDVATYRVSSSAPSSVTLTLTTTGGSCGTVTANKIIIVNPLTAPVISSTISPSASVCAGTHVTLTGSGTDTYTWTGGITNGVPFTPSSTTTYNLIATDATTGCSNFLSRTVTVNPLPAGTISSSAQGPVCAGTPVTLTVNNLTSTASYNWVGKLSTLPLDIVPGGTPFMAVGMRKLRSAYNGPCLRLKRSSDNAQMDFGFSGDYLDVASIVSWLGGSTGYCVTLYDQSGGPTHVSNPNSPPTIVINGMNGNAVLHFNTSQFLSNSYNYGLPNTFIYGSRQTGGTHQMGLSSGGGTWWLGYSGGARAQAYYGAWVTPQGSPLSDDSFHIYTGAATTGNAKIYEDGNLIANTSGNFHGAPTIQLNGSGLSNQSDIDFMDVITYITVLSDANRIAIESSIQDFYSTTRNSSLTVMPLADTVCTLTLISSQGCVSTPSVTVQISNKNIVALAGSGGNISPNGTTSICPGNNQTYTITAAPGYHIADVLIDGVSNTNAINSGSYSFTNVTADHSISATFECVAPILSAAASPSAIVCEGASVTLNGAGADTYTWSGGITNGAPFTPSATSYYTLTATNETGCSGSASWVKISTGQFHSMGIKSDGTLWTWGLNNYGQLGDGTTTNQNSPLQVGTETNWTDVSAGDYHSLAIRSDGTLWAWGYNGEGAVGDGTSIDRHLPVQVGTGKSWVNISAGMFHSMGIRSDGTLWAWGFNQWGQLGVGTNTSSYYPLQVGSATNWVSIAGGFYHSVGRKSDGTLWSWGKNGDGQLGIGTTVDANTPQQVGTATNWISVVAGFNHCMGIKSDGTLWSWGDNTFGQLGIGNYNDVTTPVQTGTAANWAHIAAGYTHTIGIKSDGTLWAWGGNGFGQLGDRTYTSRNTPAQTGTSTDWTTIAAGYNYCLGIRSGEPRLWTWGQNDYGELGTGGNYSSNTPVQTVFHPGMSIKITVEPPPTVGVMVSPSATVTAGTPVTLNGTGTNTYSWSGGVTNGVPFTPTSTTTYTVTGTSANGCTNTATQTITVNPAPVVTARNVSGCDGSPIVLSGSPAGGTFSVPNPYTGPATTYTYTYTDANGSYTSAPATITINPLPTAGIINNTGTTELSCTTTSINVTATGGTSYSWDGGATPAIASNSFDAPGTYTVTVTGANGCTSTANITISQNTAAPTAGITNNTGTTELTCITTSINVTATGGISFSWNGGASTATAANSFNAPGTYTVTVTGDNGCTSTANITISQNTVAPVASASSNSPVTAGGTLNLSSSGGQGLSWAWSGPGFSSTLQNPTISNVTTTATGVYTVVITNITSGCSASAQTSVTVNNNPCPAPTITPAIGTFCQGGSVVLSSSQALSYQWYKDGSAIGGAKSQNYTATAAGSYYVVVKVSNACSTIQSAPIAVTVTSSPAAPVTSNASRCGAGSITMIANGTGTLKWYTTASLTSLINTGSSFTVNTSVNATYYVTATNASGCVSVSAPVTATVNPLPIQYTVTGSSNCNGVTPNLSGSQKGVNYQLFRGTTALNIIAGTGASVNFGNQATAGTYTVVATIVTTGCTNTMAGSATATPGTAPGVTIADAYTNNNDPRGVAVNTIYKNYIPSYASLTLTANSSGSGLTYVWKNGSNQVKGNSSNLIVTTAGIYTVTVTNTAGCSGSAAKTISLIDVKCSGNKVQVCNIGSTQCVNTSQAQTMLTQGSILGACSNNNPIAKAKTSTADELVVTNLQVQAYPNPATNYFTLLIKSSNQDKIRMRVIDILGREVEVKPGIIPNSTIELGRKYFPGTYIVEIIQDDERRVVKLIKMLR